MPNENHDPKTGEFSSGQGGDQHGANHGEPRQHPLASADANQVHDEIKLVSKMGSRAEKIGRRTKMIPTEAHAVEFSKDGRPFRTAWTTYKGEAESWRDGIKQTGWSQSGKPLPRS
jgi:hypothetical protein